MTCPKNELLVAYQRGSDDSVLIDHIEGCDRCADLVQNLPEPSEGGLVMQIREAVEDDSTRNNVSGSRSTILDSPFPEIPGYEIERPVGKGGMGVVYKARDSKLGRAVALKMIHGRADRQTLQRFQSEAEALAGLHHPNVVSIHAVGEYRGCPYLTLEFCADGTLENLIDRGTVRFQTAAEIVEGIARGVAAAHARGVVHRDLKPANVLLVRGDRRSGGWTAKVTDFGIAKKVKGAEELTQAGQVLGTPFYMAPEQARGSKRIGPAADVWAIGVILYRLLTGQVPFRGTTAMDTLFKVTSLTPERPHSFRQGVPRDLEVICLKCLSKEPDERYASAEALAEDLRRWLDGRPIKARPVSRGERFWKWCKRNPGAAALSLSLLASVFGLMGLWASILQGKATSAERQADLARQASKLHQAQRIRLTAHDMGWSRKIWDLVKETKGLSVEGYERDAEICDEAIASLAGLDARRIKRIESKTDGASHVAFGPDGRLLIAGTKDGAKWWEPVNDVTTPLTDLSGDVRMTTDGTVLTLNWDGEDRTVLVLRELSNRKEAGRFKLPGEGKATLSGWAIAPNGEALAVSGYFPDESGFTVVWQVSTGEELWHAEIKPRVLAFAPVSNGESGLLALGYEDGRIGLHALPEGRQLATLRAEETGIRCLTFAQDTRRETDEGQAVDPLSGWLLVAGHSGGTIVLWDAEAKIPRNYFRGSTNEVNGLAFSPDGVTLASVGRGEAKLWDLSTGRLLLNLKDGRNMMTSVAFSANGSQLAVGSAPIFDSFGGVDVYDLEFGRGIRTLRGLVGPIDRTVYSADGRLLAGLSHNWQVGIWEVETGRLLHVLNIPKGEIVGNSSFGFSPDGKRFACSAFQKAGLWNVESGKQEASWKLPYGFNDNILFPEGDKLILFRVETRDPKVRPYGFGSAPKNFPRICRFRNLLGDKPLTPFAEYTDFNGHIFKSLASPIGRHVIGEGVSVEGVRKVIVWEAVTGKELWSRKVNDSKDGSNMSIDPTGELVAIEPEGDLRFLLVEAANGNLLEEFENSVALGKRAEYILARSTLRRGVAGEPLVDFRAVLDGGLPVVFDGRGHVAQGTDGGILVVDIQEVRRRLTEISLGW